MRTIRVIALLLMIAALAIATLGFAWLAGAGLPYQDPTPEMLKQQDLEVQEASWLLVGGSVFSLGCAVWLWKTRKNTT